MVSIEDAVIARLENKGKRFEILVDPELARQFRQGKGRVEDVLAVHEVFKDVRSAERASEKDLLDAFSTSNVYAIAERILKEGELQITTEQRKRMVEAKKLQIANLIARHAIDPRTDAPHPVERVIRAMEELKVRVDPFMDAESQLGQVIKAISTILPIRLQRRLLRLKIPSTCVGKVYAILKECAEPVAEHWLSNGSLEVDVKVLAGLQSELLSQLSALTKQEVDFKVLSKEEL